jgi:hypothetical protein
MESWAWAHLQDNRRARSPLIGPAFDRDSIAYVRTDLLKSEVVAAAQHHCNNPSP